VRTRLAALAVVFLAAHLPYLPPTLDDLDSINFALGVRDFDIARHQPHPPGYPVFIALGKASTAALRSAGIPAPEPRGLALLSTLAGAALIPLLFLLFRTLARHLPHPEHPERSKHALVWWATAVTVASPLFWSTASRPLSDMTGLAAAVGAQALIAGALPPRAAGGPAPGSALVLGALLSGFAIGIRSQTAVLTFPLLALALLLPRRGVPAAARLAAPAAVLAGALMWAIPLVAASGGPAGYLASLGKQAGEDFGGVTMLWTTRTARVAADAVLYSFFWPWGGLTVGGVVLAVAAAGALRLVRVAPLLLALLALAFGPYAVFHLLFQETPTVRYALPLVLPVAFLAACAVDGLGRLAVHAAGVLAVLALVRVGVPATAAYGRDGSPTFRVFHDLEASPDAGRRVIAMHAVMRRAADWEQDRLGRTIRPLWGREWLGLVELWRREPDAQVDFVADPKRTDLALFDPFARDAPRPYRWTFLDVPHVGGARPGNADLVAMRPPGWMLDRGWALTPEVAGVAAREGAAPHLAPSVAWVRAGTDARLLMIGGRNLGPAGGPAVRITVRRDGLLVDHWEADPGFFFRLVTIAPGVLTGSGYVALAVGAVAADDSGRTVPAALEQFDLQPAGRPMSGFVEGWHEPEYNPVTGRSWRWMSERAVVWVRPVGRDVTLRIAGESPLRYFESAPTVRVLSDGQELARFAPSADFVQDVILPAAALERAAGRVAIETDRWFVPAERDGSPDRRRLALRVYAAGLRP
jgi:hypothetical protein